MRLFTRLFLFLFLPFLLGSALLLFVVGKSMEAKVRADLALGARADIQAQVRMVENLLSSYQHVLRSITKEKYVAAGKPDEMAIELAAPQRHMPHVDMLFHSDPDGHAIATNKVRFNYNLQPYAEKLRRGQSVITPPGICRFTHRPVVVLLEPVRDAQGRMVGVLGASINLSNIETNFTALRSVGGTQAVLSHRGRVIIGVPGEHYAFNQPPDEAKSPITSHIVTSIGNSKTQPIVSQCDHVGDKLHIFHATIPLTGWDLALAYPEKTAFASISHLWKVGIGLLLALALASIVGLLIFRRSLLRPIQKLAAAQKAIEEGDLHIRINSTGADELGQLSRSFDHMANRLETALHDAQNAEQKFRAIFDNASYSISIFDGETVVDTNPAGGRLFRCEPEQLAGRNLLDLSSEVQPDGRPSREKLPEIIEILNTGSSYNGFWQHVRSDGSAFEVEATLNLLEIDGQHFILSIARDITLSRQLETAAHSSEEKFRRVFEASPDSMVIARLNDGKILECNQGFERASGYSRDESIGRTFVELNMWVCPEERERMVERMVAEGLVQNFHSRLRRKDGSIFDALASTGTFILNGVSHYIAIVRDITPEMTTQRALAASEARLQTILDAAPTPIAINRLSDFTYISVNAAHERLFGVNAGEVKGKTIRQAGITFLDRDKVHEQTTRLLADGKVDNEETEAIDAKGHRVAYIYSSRVIELEGEQVILSISTDITRLKQVEEGLRRTEEALRESEQRFFALFQSSPAALAVFHCGKHGYTVLQLNQVWFDTFRYPEEEVIGMQTKDFNLWQDDNDRIRFLAQIESSGQIASFEAWLNRKDGKPLLCSMSGRTVSVGKHKMLLVAYADITQQREFEAALHDFNITLELRIEERTRELQQAQESLVHSERLAALGSLVAGVAHELSTPIGNTLVVATTLSEQTDALQKLMQSGMKRSALESYLRDSSTGLGIVERNLRRASELIQNFRSVAVDQTSTQRRKFNLAAIVDETLTALGPSLKKKPYVIQREIPDNMELDSFPGPLEQVVINLVNNAILHGFEDREEGTILIQAETVGEERIRLVISDNGQGVSTTGLRRIFDPFYTTKLGKGGSGLGLHIVRNIVEDVLGGHIVADSAPGEGLAMIIDIPRHAPELDRKAEAGRPEQIGKGEERQEKTET